MALVVRTPYAGLLRHGWFPETRFSRAGRSYGPLAETWTPNIEISRKDGTVTYAVALEDVKPADINVTTHEDGITFTATREQERHVERKGFEFTQKSSSRFSRTVPLPGGADWEKTEARFEDGVLTVTVPVAPEPEPEVRHIPISVSQSTEAGETEPNEPVAGEPEPHEPRPAA